MDKYILTRQVSSPGPHDTDWILSGLPHPGPVHLKHFKASPGWRPLIANMQMTSNNRPRDIVASGLTGRSITGCEEVRTVASGSVQAPTKSSQHNVAEGFDIDSAGPWTPLPLMLLLLPPPRPPPPTPLAAAMTDAASIHFMQLSLGCMRRIVSSMRERRRKKDGKGKGCMCGKGRHFSYIRN